nr:RNA polymerase sigma factor [uncultured Brevundimonas sp.]
MSHGVAIGSQLLYLLAAPIVGFSWGRMILPSRFPSQMRDVDEVDRRLQAHVRARVANRQDAEDIAQETWARMAAVSGRDAGGIENVRAYLFRIARNLVIDHRRRAVSTVEVKVDEAAMERVADARPDPESVLITRTELRRMDRIMAAMPARPREVFRLSRIEGLSFAEIGRRLGTSRQTVHEHMTRALLAIQIAAETDFDPEP